MERNIKIRIKDHVWTGTERLWGEEERGQEATPMPKQFNCYSVQKTESVFHPAKLASGANYPVGWVQMPHSVRSGGGHDGVGVCTHRARAKTEEGSREHSRPGVESL